MELHQRPDGRISIRDAGGDYEATLSGFASDRGEVFPPLPAGFDERIYAPGERHVLTDAKGNAFPQTLPWPPGDAILAKLTDLRAARQVRETPPPPPARQPVLTVDDLAARFLAKGVLTAAEIEAAKT